MQASSAVKQQILIVLWLAVVGFGFATALGHDYGGVTTIPRHDWPSASKFVAERGSMTAIMFCHPHCPCTRASLTELSALKERCRNVKLFVCFIQPAGAAENWVKSANWKQACAIDGVTVAIDERGREADLFGATASGELLIFNKSGTEIFRGGITGSRGHEGESTSLIYAVTALMNERETKATPVFGCLLQGDR